MLGIWCENLGHALLDESCIYSVRDEIGVLYQALQEGDICGDALDAEFAKRAVERPAASAKLFEAE
jgi:hypothetical protein